MRGIVEQIGSKPKFWFQYQDTDWLFKEARTNTGEDWAEKVASEIAAGMGLPAHHSELALYEGQRGCAVRSFLETPGSVLVHGNELLGAIIPGYDKSKTYGQAEHTFDNIVKVITQLFPDESDRKAANTVVGYTVLDALIGNTDRHHQNWGVLLEPADEEQVVHFRVRVAPTFDHASSLGRELTDHARQMHLTNRTVEKYLMKAKGGIFEHAGAKHGMSPIALAKMVQQRYPDFYRPWLIRLKEQPSQYWRDVIDRIPEERMSVPSKQFALTALQTSRSILLES